MPIIVLGYDFADDDIGYEVRDDDVGSLLLGLQPGGHLQYSTVQYSILYSTVQFSTWSSQARAHSRLTPASGCRTTVLQLGVNTPWAKHKSSFVYKLFKSPSLNIARNWPTFLKLPNKLN